MSDEIKAPEVAAPEDVKAKAKAERIAARVNQLKEYEGKTFVKNGTDSPVIKVVKYDGVKVKNGQSAHTFVVEGGDARWTPPAAEFLANYTEVTAPAPKTEINDEPI